MTGNLKNFVKFLETNQGPSHTTAPPSIVHSFTPPATTQPYIALACNGASCFAGAAPACLLQSLPLWPCATTDPFHDAMGKTLGSARIIDTCFLGVSSLDYQQVLRPCLVCKIFTIWLL